MELRQLCCYSLSEADADEETLPRLERASNTVLQGEGILKVEKNPEKTNTSIVFKFQNMYTDTEYCIT